MKDPYAHLNIRSFTFWDLYLHEQQYPYVGRSYAWAKRDANTVLEITAQEREELYTLIIPAWWKVLKQLFNPDRPNIACFGNEAPHLHYHLIPRYRHNVFVQGIPFTDPKPDKNYAPYEKRVLPVEVLCHIKEEMQSTIEKIVEELVSSQGDKTSFK
ncbi:hypothetical protein D6774_02875 [Candidatus Woesearchaeota archaeon]|nr:MAG: hypothetical protein D6774_02875 [Candidatus Woesearchaeota archaeon]